MIHFYIITRLIFNHFSTDCFQFETIIHLPEIGVPLVHMLGAIISGSQVFYLVPILFWLSMLTNSPYFFNFNQLFWE